MERVRIEEDSVIVDGDPLRKYVMLCVSLKIKKIKHSLQAFKASKRFAFLTNL